MSTLRLSLKLDGANFASWSGSAQLTVRLVVVQWDILTEKRLLNEQMVMPITCGRKKTGWSRFGFKSVSVHNAGADVFIFVEEPIDFAVCFSFVVLKVKSVTGYLLVQDQSSRAF